MLAYTAADGLHAIKRTYGVEVKPAAADRVDAAVDSKRRTSPTVWRNIVDRAGRLVASLTI